MCLILNQKLGSPFYGSKLKLENSNLPPNEISFMHAFMLSVFQESWQALEKPLPKGNFFYFNPNAYLFWHLAVLQLFIPGQPAGVLVLSLPPNKLPEMTFPEIHTYDCEQKSYPLDLCCLLSLKFCNTEIHGNSWNFIATLCPLAKKTENRNWNERVVLETKEKWKAIYIYFHFIYW